MGLCRLGLHMSRLICEWIAVETIAGMSCAAVALKAALPEALYVSEPESPRILRMAF